MTIRKSTGWLIGRECPDLPPSQRYDTLGQVVYEAWIRVNLLMSARHLSKLRKLEISPIGLASPPVLPPMNAAADRFGRHLAYVLLCYGKNPLDAAEPVIEMQTCPDDDDWYGPPALNDVLTRAVLRDIARASRPLRLVHSVWDENFHSQGEGFRVTAPEDGFAAAQRSIIVQATEQETTVISHGHYEALRFHHGNLIVTALARHGFPKRLAFQAIGDLEPFITAGKQLLHSIAQAKP
jgi:hypothetical protein